MNEEIVKQGIRLLVRLFYDGKNKNEELAITSTELLFELGLFDDIGTVARLIEEEQAFALLEKMKLFDYEFVEDVEMKLRGLSN